jgi:hypothetical protein
MRWGEHVAAIPGGITSLGPSRASGNSAFTGAEIDDVGWLVVTSSGATALSVPVVPM